MPRSILGRKSSNHVNIIIFFSFLLFLEVVPGNLIYIKYLLLPFKLATKYLGEILMKAQGVYGEYSVM